MNTNVNNPDVVVQVAQQKHVAVVAPLLPAGAPVDATLQNGLTEGNATAVDVLLRAGVDVQSASPKGRTILPMAAMTGHQDVVQVLLEAQADVHTANASGRTALSAGCTLWAP